MQITLPRHPDPVASIIISVSSSPRLLLACLRSIEAFGPKELPFETIVVMNALRGDDEDMLRSTVSGCEFMSSSFNLGLAGASNLGRSAARGEYLVILHDDAEIDPGWLESLVASARANPRAGAIGSKILFPNGTLQNAGMILWQDALTGPPWVGEPPAPTMFSTVRAVDYCGTSSLLAPACAWDLLGGFDERFYPAYYVDVDFCTGLWSAGFSVLFEPASTIRHHRGASSSDLLKQFMLNRNRKRFIEKWGACLDDQVSRDVGALSASIERAQSRSAHRADAPVAPATAPAQREPFAAEARVRRHIEQIGIYYKELATFLDERMMPPPRPIPPYLLGTELSFGVRGNAGSYLVAGGFHAPEEWGLWTRASLRILLPIQTRSTRPASLKLDMTASHLILPARPRSRVEVKIDGASILTIVEDRVGVQSYTVDVPSGVLSSRGCLVLDIECDEVLSPEQIGLSADQRVLGLGLHTLRLDFNLDGDSERQCGARLAADEP